MGRGLKKQAAAAGFKVGAHALRFILDRITVARTAGKNLNALQAAKVIGRTIDAALNLAFNGLTARTHGDLLLKSYIIFSSLLACAAHAALLPEKFIQPHKKGWKYFDIFVRERV